MGGLRGARLGLAVRPRHRARPDARDRPAPQPSSARTASCPTHPADKAATLADAGLAAVGQFVPVVLHDPGHDPLPEVERALDGLVAAEATTLVLAAATGVDGYDARPMLDDPGWATLLGNLDRLADAAARSRPRRHPAPPRRHHGRVAARRPNGSSTAAASASASTPATCSSAAATRSPLARRHPDRIAHVHLKDVRAAVADRVRSGELTYTDAIRGGLYVPLGRGDVDVAAIVGALEDAGYDGWYVLEQDTILDGDPGATGPAQQVEESLDHLLGLAAQRSGVGA